MTISDTPDRATLEQLFEGAPHFIDRLVAAGGASWNDLFDRADVLALEMQDDEQLELLNAHPRIGAAPSSVSALSYREQGYDRDAGTAALQQRLDRLNDEYEARHGFRFVIFVNGRPREVIADLMPEHLERPSNEELRRALGDVVAIARSRLARMREESIA